MGLVLIEGLGKDSDLNKEEAARQSSGQDKIFIPKAQEKFQHYRND